MAESKDRYLELMPHSISGLPPEARAALEETEASLARRSGRTPAQIRVSLEELKQDRVKNPNYVSSRASDLSVEIMLSSASPDEKQEFKNQLSAITSAFMTANPPPAIVRVQNEEETLADGSVIYHATPIHWAL